MKTKNLFTAFVVMLFLAGGVTLVPGAEAQNLAEQCGNAIKASIKNHGSSGLPGSAGDAIKPITDTRTVSGTLLYEAGESARSLTPVTVTLDVDVGDESWAAVSVVPQTHTFPIPQSGATSEEIPVEITIDLNNRAPAFQTQKIVITATANDGTCVQAPDSAFTWPMTLKAGFYERYEAQFEKAIWQTGQNSQVSIPLTIQNFGNGDIEARISINERTSKDLNVAPPAQILVRSLVSGGETDKSTVNIDVQTPFKNGYTNQRDALILDLRGNSADERDIGITDLQLHAVIQTQGVYVPGFEAVTMTAALLGVALVARRRLGE